MVMSKDFIWYARLNPIALEDEYQLNHTPLGPGVFDYQGSSITESAGDILSQNDFPQN
jgi:hypothetical protein